MKIIKLIIKFTKKIINYYKFLSKTFLQELSIKCKFLKFSYRVININKYTFLELNDIKLSSYNIAKNFEDLVYKIFNLVKSSKFNIQILGKFLFLINYSSRKKYYLNFVEEYISKLNLNFNKLPNLSPFIVDPFNLVGDYKTAERFSLILRKKKDKFYRREAGLYNERSHLTAIGHLCLFSYYLKSRELNFLGNDNSSFLFNKNKISNNLFFQIIKERAEKLNVVVKETNKKFDYFNQDEYEIGLWPCKERKKYIPSASIKGIIEEEWIIKNKSNKFFEASYNILSKANLLLKNKNILQSNKWFIGIHLRNKQDTKKLRNADFKNIIHICKVINCKGGEVIFTGTDPFEDLRDKGSITFLNDLKLTRDENELLQLFVWSQASFFVGNLSGGTIPPSLFGTPIVWVDVHPTAHVREPSQQDTTIPKRVFHIKNQKYLSFNEANSYKHFKCQTESEYLAKIAGYKILSSELGIVDQVIKFYISKYVFKDKNINSNFFPKDHYLPSEKGAFYKF